MSFNVELQGFDQFTAELARLGANLERAVGNALVAELKEMVLPASQELVPVDTGALKASGFVDGPEVGGGSVSASIGFDTPYALKQHEDLNLNHPHGGQAKFLEQPLSAWAEGGAERVVRRALDEVGR